MIGYWLLQALQNALPGRQVAAVVNQTLVSAADPAFDAPTKFVGPVYDEPTAHRLANERGWRGAPGGPYWRRGVPAPMPPRLGGAPGGRPPLAPRGGGGRAGGGGGPRGPPRRRGP